MQGKSADSSSGSEVRQIKPIITSQPLVSRTKRWAPRARTGCLTCRSRRLKCDETKPECKRCKAACMPCKGTGYGSSSGPDLTRRANRSQPWARMNQAPPSTPRLHGTAAVRDLLNMLSVITANATQFAISNAKSTTLEYHAASLKETIIYLEFLPSRLGRDAALDSTIECVALTLRDMYLPKSARSLTSIYSAYARALKYLQSSIQSTEYLSSETLCATQLLGIFESLMHKNGQASTSHIQGTIQIIKLRGPGKFKTEFEKSLLLSYLPVITTFHSTRGEASFLDDPDWMATIHSTIMTTPNNYNRSAFCVSTYDYLIPYSRILGIVAGLVMDPRMSSNKEARNAALNDVAIVRGSLARWYRQYSDVIHQQPGEKDFFDLGVGDSWMRRFTEFTTWRVNNILYGRLHTALGGPGALELEKSTRDEAQSIIEDENVQQYASSYFTLMLAIILSRTILQTTDGWQGHMAAADDKTPAVPVLIAPELFGGWMGLLGMISKND